MLRGQNFICSMSKTLSKHEKCKFSTSPDICMVLLIQNFRFFETLHPLQGRTPFKTILESIFKWNSTIIWIQNQIHNSNAIDFLSQLQTALHHFQTQHQKSDRALFNEVKFFTIAQHSTFAKSNQLPTKLWK